jgi:predicted metalloprotease with PDZ domain
VLEYRIDVRRPAAREIEVVLEFVPGELPGAVDAEPSAEGRGQTSTRRPDEETSIELFLPTWTPGSYLIREYSRHLGRLQVTDAADGTGLPCRKVAKNRYRIALRARERRVRVGWRVHAHELTVRTADVTAEHAYWNHACLLLWPCGAESVPARLTIRVQDGWDLACTLPRAARADLDPVDGAVSGPIVFAPASFDRIMDTPVLAGRLQRLDWRTRGVPHTVVLDGLGPISVPPRLASDLQAVVEAAADVFEGALPYQRYLFASLFTAEGQGGLEHADCTTLLAPRTALATDKGYLDFVSLAAHELFHAWNVKRMRPAELWRYDYERENYTEFLWLIEGWTAYYDDLLCLRAGVCTRQQYLEAAARNVNAMLAAPGRFALSLRESSFDAWIRLYRPDANTRNSSQNYYVNGAVAAMCLDLWLRRETRGARSLDDVVRALYQSTFSQHRGYTMADVQRVLADVAGAGAGGFLSGLLDGALDPDLRTLLAAAGIALRTNDADRPFLGVQFESASTVVAAVTGGSPAHEAGIAPGDELIALGGVRVDAARWQDVWQSLAKVGAPLPLLYARRGLVATGAVVPRGSPGTVTLAVDATADASARALLAGWLVERPPPATAEIAAAP